MFSWQHLSTSFILQRAVPLPSWRRLQSRTGKVKWNWICTGSWIWQPTFSWVEYSVQYICLFLWIKTYLYCNSLTRIMFLDSLSIRPILVNVKLYLGYTFVHIWLKLRCRRTSAHLSGKTDFPLTLDKCFYCGCMPFDCFFVVFEDVVADLLIHLG